MCWEEETSHFPTDQVDLLLHGVLDLNEVLLVDLLG